MGLLDRLAPRRSESEPPVEPDAATDELLFPTKALGKLLSSLAESEYPSLIDLGPVVGSNVSFFGELGCKVHVADLYAEVDRHAREGILDTLPDTLSRRFPQADSTVDGVICWDLFDYLDRRAAQALADQLTRVLRPRGTLLGFFGTGQPSDLFYTKYVIVDETNLKHRPYPAVRGREPILPNREVIRLFSGLRVSDSFLMKNNVREILFRKPTYAIR